jgi:hypothetical protein
MTRGDGKNVFVAYCKMHRAKSTAGFPGESPSFALRNSSEVFVYVRNEVQDDVILIPRCPNAKRPAWFLLVAVRRCVL